MNVDFVRFKTSDDVELRGWFSDGDSETAAIHIHGMSGNGYENYFLDNLREMYNKNGIAFFPIDTRGSGYINSFWQGSDLSKWGEGTKVGGSCFEIFEESVHDIQGAIDYLKTLGKSKFILQGHSLGGSKVVNYIVSKKTQEIIAAVLLAPTNMPGWAGTDSNHKNYLQKANKLIAKGKGEELVSAECWLDKTPISAQTYPTICEAGRAVDIYGNSGKAPLGKVEVPTLIIYGDADIGILRVDGSMDKWLDRVNKIKNNNTKVSIIQGASHSFRDCEDKLTREVKEFLKKL